MKKILGILCSIILLAGVVTVGGCKGKYDPNKIYVITEMGMTYDSTKKLLTEIEEKFDVKFEFVVFSPGDATTQKNLYLTDGKHWDVMLDNNLAMFKPLKEKNRLYDISADITQTYPDIFGKLPEYAQIDITETDGKIFSLPLSAEYNVPCIMVRRDMLEQIDETELEGKIDITVEDYERMIGKFISTDLYDPDNPSAPKFKANGITETWGIASGFYSAYASAPMMTPWISLANEQAYNHWLVNDPQSVVYIAAMRSWFKSGLMHENFYKLTNAQVDAGFANGTAPVSHTSLGRDFKVPELQGKIAYLYPPKGPMGQGAGVEQRSFYRWIFNKNIPQKHLDSMMEIINWQTTQEGFDRSYYGEADVDYTLNSDGSYKHIGAKEFPPSLAFFQSSTLKRLDESVLQLPSYAKQLEEVESMDYPVNTAGILSSGKIFSDMLSEKYFTDGRDSAVNRYFTSETAKFITGDEPLENWQNIRDEYKKMIKDFGDNYYDICVTHGFNANDPEVQKSTFKHFNDLKEYATTKYDEFSSIITKAGGDPEKVIKSLGYTKSGSTWVHSLG